MSNTTETRSVPTYQFFYSRPTRHTRPPFSLPSSPSLPRAPPRTRAISLVETRLERLDIKLAKIYPFSAQRLRYAPSRYLVEFAQFILDCDASNNASPNWEAALTILIQKHLIQRKDASPAYAPFSTLNATMCFMNPRGTTRRFDQGRTLLERQINSERRRESLGPRRAHGGTS